MGGKGENNARSKKQYKQEILDAKHRQKVETKKR
jgi:hypothetical protein